jgi:large subunit ribosomal protein L10
LAISLKRKQELVAEYVERLQRTQALLITEYRGLTVKQLEALRRELRECDSEILVAKNTLIARALTEKGMPVPEQLLKGPTAVAFCYGELAAPAKALAKHAKDTKILTVRGGLLERTILNAGSAAALADLPGRDQLRAQVVGALQAPLSGLVNVLSGPMRGFITVLSARADRLAEAA